METASPARLYATVAGVLLTIGGIAGFFYSASFGSPGEVDEMLGIFAVNGWDNVLHLATGLLGLVATGYAARRYALALGALLPGGRGLGADRRRWRRRSPGSSR